MTTRLPLAFAVAVVSASIATSAYGMTSGKFTAVIAYAALMTLGYALGERFVGQELDVPALVFAVVLPGYLLAVLLLGHRPQHHDVVAIIVAAVAAAAAYVFNKRRSSTTRHVDA